MLQTKKLERLVRGFANHRRIEMLNLLEKEPELSIFDITRTLSINYKTASEHVRRLAIAGLVMKRNEGPSVRHALTKQGKLIQNISSQYPRAALRGSFPQRKACRGSCSHRATATEA